MASLEFNLFDELENSDPRVEHYLQSRLDSVRNSKKPVVVRRWSTDDGQTNDRRFKKTREIPSKRIHASRIPPSILDSSLKETLRQFGDFTEYRRLRDSRPGFQGYTYLRVTFDTVEAATAALLHLSQLDFGGGYLPVKFTSDNSSTAEKMEDGGKNIDGNDNGRVGANDLERHVPIRVTFMPIDVDADNARFLDDGMCCVTRPSATQLNENVEKLHWNLESQVEEIRRSRPPINAAIGEDVLALYDGQFYRALVLDKPTQHQYKVWFTDWCNVEVVRIESIRKMKRVFKDLCPRVGHLCQLAGVRPVRDNRYTSVAIEWMTKQVSVSNNIVEIEVIGETRIPNGVIKLITVRVTDQTRQKTFRLEEEMIALEYGARIDTEPAAPVASAPSPVRLLTPPPVSPSSNGPPSYASSFPINTRDMHFRKFSEFRDPIRATIIEFETPCDFWLAADDESDDLKRIQSEAHRVGASASPTATLPKANDMVLAFWTDDDGFGAFYRAAVIRASDGGFHVRFVDYGNMDDVELKNIRSIPQELAEFPMQALHCSLVLPKPPPPKWDRETAGKALSIFTQSGSGSVICEVRGQDPSDASWMSTFKVVIRGSDNKSFNQKVMDLIDQNANSTNDHAANPGNPQNDDGGIRPPSNPRQLQSTRRHSTPPAERPPKHSPSQRSAPLAQLQQPPPQLPPPQQQQLSPHPPLQLPPSDFGKPSPQQASNFGKPNYQLYPPVPSQLPPHQHPTSAHPSSSPSSSAVKATVAAPPPTPPSFDGHAVTPYEKRLEERVDALERLVEEQRKQIGALLSLVEAKDGETHVDEGLEQRLQDVEAGVNLVKRNHDALQLELIKKKVL